MYLKKSVLVALCLCAALVYSSPVEDVPEENEDTKVAIRPIGIVYLIEVLSPVSFRPQQEDIPGADQHTAHIDNNGLEAISTEEISSSNEEKNNVESEEKLNRHRRSPSKYGGGYGGGGYGGNGGYGGGGNGCNTCGNGGGGGGYGGGSSGSWSQASASSGSWGTGGGGGYGK